MGATQFLNLGHAIAVFALAACALFVLPIAALVWRPARSAAGWLARLIDEVTGAIGKTCAWLGLLMAFGIGAAVVLRYAFGLSFAKLDEAIMAAHAAMIVGAAAWTLAENGHVRVDVLAEKLSPRQRAAIEWIGAMAFLAPFAALIFWASAPYVAASWRVFEASTASDGLRIVFLVKTLGPALALMLGAQALAQACEAALALTTHNVAAAGAAA